MRNIAIRNGNPTRMRARKTMINAFVSNRLQKLSALSERDEVLDFIDNLKYKYYIHLCKHFAITSCF